MRLTQVDLGPALVGAVMALAGVLFLAEPFVDPIPVGGVEVPVVALSFVALAVALDLGAVVFYRRGQRAAWQAHGVAGLGWSLLVLGPLFGSVLVMWLGIAVVVGGGAFLVVERYQDR
ncbi:MAG: hypothetical protein ACI8XM_002797 [Haloarculaceae archaeon]|jgi:hypothetical protein